jgi:purine-nucleoside phosphorylase
MTSRKTFPKGFRRADPHGDIDNVKTDDALINPTCGKPANRIGPLAFLVSSDQDRRWLIDALRLDPGNARPLLMSHVVGSRDARTGPSVCGPFVGAPYAVILLENLIARGAETVIFFGWCGAIHPDVRIGDLILPPKALIDEGTSTHYGAAGPWSSACGSASEALLASAQNVGDTLRQGPVWTTDAVFRETPAKIRAHRRKGILGVEMELSAVFSVCAFRHVTAAAVLAVSDALTGPRWQPGFRDPAFTAARRRACRLLADHSGRLLRSPSEKAGMPHRE